MPSIERSRRYLQSAALLRWCLYQNREDLLFAKHGGRLVYLMDANVVCFFINPKRDRRHVTAFGRDVHEELDTSMALATAEYLFSRGLPGQCDSPALVTPAHGDDIDDVVSVMDQSSAGMDASASELASGEALRDVLRQLAEKLITHDEAIGHLYRLVPTLADELLNGTVQETAQLLRLYNGDLLRPLALHPAATRDILNLSAKSATHEHDEWIRRLSKERLAATRRGADNLIRRDAESLVQVMRLDTNAMTERARVRYVMVTADQSLFAAYVRWYWRDNPDKPQQNFLLRHILQYSPPLSIRDPLCDLDTTERARALDSLFVSIPHMRDGYPEKLVYHQLSSELGSASGVTGHRSVLEEHPLDIKQIRALSEAREIWLQGVRNSVVLSSELIQLRRQKEFELLTQVLRKDQDLLTALQEKQRKLIAELFAIHASVTTRTNVLHLVKVDSTPPVTRHVPLILRHDFSGILDAQTLEEAFDKLVKGDRSFAQDIEDRLVRANHDDRVFFAACVAYRGRRWRAAQLYSEWLLDVAQSRPEADAERLDRVYLKCAILRGHLISVEDVRRSLLLCEDMTKISRRSADHFALCRALCERASLLLVALMNASFDIHTGSRSIWEAVRDSSSSNIVDTLREALDILGSLEPSCLMLASCLDLSLLRLGSFVHFLRGNEEYGSFDCSEINRLLTLRWTAITDLTTDCVANAERMAVGARLGRVPESRARAVVCVRVKDTLSTVDRAVLDRLQTTFKC